MARLILTSLLGVCVLIAATCGASSADADACATVYAALAKLAMTPNHQFMATRSDTRPGIGSNEIITTRNSMYVEVEGRWHARAYDRDDARRQIEQAAKSPGDQCRYLRGEPVDGAAAKLYQTNKSDADGSSVDTRLWISTETGLPLRQQIDVDVGAAHGKSHTDVRFDYTDVTAPADVR